MEVRINFKNPLGYILLTPSSVFIKKKTMLHVHESSCVSVRVFLKIMDGMSIKMNTAKFEVRHLEKKKHLLENSLCQLHL